ncbi:phosphate acyltransferase [Luteitalea sp. TBR-22]|uniref:phosphate acyltransferase PlsX n=1 Tax=Luteitalea sp. TBR-22 TaxID=2802971 RepID=UPI001AF86528|nr:phosphate acyltransferase PlsX [Luteitalea sp. TBR-22]BCS34119.1 phosphate acyltransferase [Luteitalea sp. TBR-22]
MRIAVDAMGGDEAPRTVVHGAVLAAREDGLDLTLVGARALLEDELARFPEVDSLSISILDAADVVGMGESALAVRRRRTASVRVAAEAVAAGDAAALFTAGHSGAAVLAAHAAFGFLDGIERPAIAATIPTREGAAVLVDAGASVSCRPEHLVVFARLGAAYAQVALGIDRPRVGLVSNGEEAGKGTSLVRGAHARIAETSLHFIGNLDASELFTGAADVIVCDGFTGNVVLKTSEGLVEAIDGLMADEMARSVTAQVGAVLTRGALRRFRARLDYSEYGGAPLLGLRHLCVIGHGRSSPKAIATGIGLTARFVRERLVARLTEGLQERGDARGAALRGHIR